MIDAVFMTVMFVYSCGIQYASRWMDAAHGTKYHTGHRNDTWHKVRRYGVLYPSVVVPAIVACVVALFGVSWWVSSSIVPAGLTGRLWFRLGVHRVGKYRDWYGSNFSVWGALIGNRGEG